MLWAPNKCPRKLIEKYCMIVNLGTSSQLLNNLHKTLFHFRICCLKMLSGCDTESLSKMVTELIATHIFVSWKHKHELTRAFHLQCRLTNG